MLWARTQMPREHFVGGSPDGALGFYHTMQPGAATMTVTLQQPRVAAPNCAWFVHYAAPPARAADGDPLAAVARRAVGGRAGDALRAYVIAHGVRALLFVPGRGSVELRALVIAAELADDLWTLARVAHAQQRRAVFVRVFRAFAGPAWPVFPLRASLDELGAGGALTLPALDAPYYAGGRRFTVSFGVLTDAPAVRKTRAARFGDRVLSCVAGQGRALPEVCFHTRREGDKYVPVVAHADLWMQALGALAGDALVVGPLYFLVIASRYVLSMSRPELAAQLVDARLRGRLMRQDAEMPPDAFLPPRATVLWADVPEIAPAPAPAADPRKAKMDALMERFRK